MYNVAFGWFIIGLLFGIIIWFFVNRASVRANRQVELLEAIDNKLKIIINQNATVSNVEKTDDKYLEEARQSLRS